MIDLHWLYVLAGAVFAGFAIGSARDATNRKRLGNTAFWGLIAFSFWFGDFLGDIGNGVLVLALVAITGVHLLGKGSKASTSVEEREGFSERYGNKLFLPALIIPFTAFVGTVVFTMIMGNAFAAFPVMIAAIGVPILIQQDGGNPAVIGAVGMLAGFCGTLMTPMAANFNIVPAALLELKNQYGVIRAQVPTAIPLLIANILILYVAGFLL